jgi:hypothetical protein
MSKPDPSITANLLNTVLGKAEAHPEGAGKHPVKPGHTEAHPDPAPKPAKPKTTKNNAGGPGRMRSSNRGK